MHTVELLEEALRLPNRWGIERGRSGWAAAAEVPVNLQVRSGSLWIWP